MHTYNDLYIYSKYVSDWVVRKFVVIQVSPCSISQGDNFLMLSAWGGDPSVPHCQRWLKNHINGFTQALKVKLDRWNYSDSVDSCASTKSKVIVTERERDRSISLCEYMICIIFWHFNVMQWLVSLFHWINYDWG